MKSEEQLIGSILSDLDLPQMQVTPKKQGPFQEQHQQNNIITAKDINGFYKSLDTFHQFVQRIGSLKYSAMRNDVIEHCDRIKAKLNTNYVTITQVEFMMKNRIEKIIKNKKIKKNWSQQDVYILIWIISKYTSFHEIEDIQAEIKSHHWEQIALMIPGVKGQNCMFKWLSLKKFNLAENCWSETQSELLTKIVRQNGCENWNFVAQQLYMHNNQAYKIFRCPKQCREHWNCYLNPKLKKGPWTREEDIMLLKKIIQNNGKKKWAQFVKSFNGRTQNALKNRYCLLLEKQRQSQATIQNKSQLKIVQDYLQKIYVEQFVNPEQKIIDNDQTKIAGTNLTKDSTKPIRSMTLRERKKLSYLPEMESREDRQKKAKYQEQILQIKKEVNYEQIHQNSPVHSIDNNHFIRSEFSDFTPAKIQSNYFGDFKSSAKKEVENGHQELKSLLPSVDNIQIVQFNMQDFQGLKTNLCSNQLKIVPCQIRQNKLIKFQNPK